MKLERHGAELAASTIDQAGLDSLETAVELLSSDRPGVRVQDCPALRALIDANGPVGRIVANRVGFAFRAVRAILFDKSEKTNWALGWHQDRTIAVAEQSDVAGFGPWTVKAGVQHVEPPIELLERMITVRVHLDSVDEENAPLLIAPGSHRFGRIAEANIDAVVGRCGSYACLADRGSIWFYATLMLHASGAAARPLRRRVLQVDYSADDLPSGLSWYGV